MDPRVVLIGDSHAVMWSKLVDEITEELDLTTSLWSINGELVFPYNDQVWQPGVCLTKGQRMEYDSARMRFIKKWNPDVVIIACGWEKVDKSVADETVRFSGIEREACVAYRVATGTGSGWQSLPLPISPVSWVFSFRLFDRQPCMEACEFQQRFGNQKEAGGIRFRPIQFFFRTDCGSIHQGGRRYRRFRKKSLVPR